MTLKKTITKKEKGINKSKTSIFGNQELSELLENIIERTIHAPRLSINIDETKTYLGEDGFNKIFGDYISTENYIDILNQQEEIKRLKSKKENTERELKKLYNLISRLIIPRREINKKRKRYEIIRNEAETHLHKLTNRLIPFLFGEESLDSKYFWKAINKEKKEKKNCIDLKIDELSGKEYELQTDKTFLIDFKKDKNNKGYKIIHGANTFKSEGNNKYGVILLEGRIKTENKITTKLIKRLCDDQYSPEYDKINDFQALRVVTKDNSTHSDLIIDLINNFKTTAGNYTWKHKKEEKEKYLSNGKKQLKKDIILSGYTEINYQNGTTIIIDSKRYGKIIKNKADVPYNAIHLDIAMNLKNGNNELKTQSFEFQIMDKQNYIQSEETDPKKVHKKYDKDKYNVDRPKITYIIEKRISDLLNLQRN